MILPKEVKTRNKIRDFKIVQLYAQGKTQEEIAQLFGISHQAISNIISKNRSLLKIDKDFESAKRYARLTRILAKTSDALSPKKDVLNVIAEMRNESEGDKPLIQINEYTQIWNNSTEKVENLDSNGRINFRSKAQSQA